MTPAEAEVLATELFDGHPAAAALLIESQHGETAERRRRSWVALLALDPDRDLPEAWPESDDRMTEWHGSHLAAPAQAIADLLLLVVYGARPESRVRAARLLDDVCSKVMRLVRSGEAAA